MAFEHLCAVGPKTFAGSSLTTATLASLLALIKPSTPWITSLHSLFHLSRSPVLQTSTWPLPYLVQASWSERAFSWPLHPQYPPSLSSPLLCFSSSLYFSSLMSNALGWPKCSFGGVFFCNLLNRNLNEHFANPICVCCLSPTELKVPWEQILYLFSHLTVHGTL